MPDKEYQTDATDQAEEELPLTERDGKVGTGGIALCLSGGGYRAMLFHLGTLWRLNELGYLPKLDRVSSVSGGSITAGVLGGSWGQLSFDSQGVATDFLEKMVEPVLRFSSVTVDVWAILKGVLGPGSVSKRVAATYRKHLFGSGTLQDLPGDDEGPRFVFNATNVQSGVLVRFSKPYIWDYRVGKVPNPTVGIAETVAASSAFPPVLSPAVLTFPPGSFAPGTGKDLEKPPFTTRMVLSDGGVYDNLGLETAWKQFGTVLVSDGGAKLQPDPKPSRFWGKHAVRVVNIIDNQVRSLRYRELIDRYQTGALAGAYWGIGTDIGKYQVPSLPSPPARTRELARVETRLKAMPRPLCERLVNWGYAVCDAAIRRYVVPGAPPATEFPLPDNPV